MLLTIFHDGNCPLCSKEIDQLKVLNRDDKLSFEDIQAEDFVERYPQIDKREANRILHGQLASGEMIYGLDVTCLAWKTVGKHRWLAILRWPVIRWFADLVYLFFARYRNTISSFFISKNKDKTNPDECRSCKTPK